jgi:hypothetical protein
MFETIAETIEPGGRTACSQQLEPAAEREYDSADTGDGQNPKPDDSRNAKERSGGGVIHGASLLQKRRQTNPAADNVQLTGAQQRNPSIHGQSIAG